MSTNKQMLKNIICIIIGVLLILGAPMSLQALSLTEEEKDYIEQTDVIKAVSSEGAAPLQYTDKEGMIRGISPRILEEISEMTGLIFKYELCDSIEGVLASDYDLIFGASSSYITDNLVLSPAYIKTETIMYINSSADPNKLENKIYATIEGSSLPEGIKEENVRYYQTREETLDAVEAGKADYGYGNAYSVAFYTLQNGYKNMVTIPKRKESREYGIGVPKENVILASIINKSLEAIDSQQMQTLILDETSRIERKIAFSMVMDTYGNVIFTVTFLTLGILLCSVFIISRAKNKLMLQNKRYELLSQISNEYLYDYFVKDKHLKLSDKCVQLFGTNEVLAEAIGILKETLFNNGLKENVAEIQLPLINGGSGVFKAVSSKLSDEKGKIYAVVGKLIDISAEVAERKELVARAQVDGLTGLYNAATTKQLITGSMKNNNKGEIDALIIMDCDEFKSVNDTFGHLVGDKVLQDLSAALKCSFRETDIIGRIGGDEFSVYMKDIHSVETAILKYQEVNNLIQETSREFHISVSAGIAVLQEEKTYEELFKKADDALYEAKRKGGSQAYGC